MTPLDLLWWSLAILVASVPIGLAIMIVGYCIILVLKESRKARIVETRVRPVFPMEEDEHA